MLSARMYGINDLRMERVPVPEIGPGELLVEVKAAAVCGTDVRIFQNGAANVSPETPLILGHEMRGWEACHGISGRTARGHRS